MTKAQTKRSAIQGKSSNMLRIIGGHWRGRRLPVADIDGLRPSPDHLRETLFNWLMFTIEGATCLDAFAGTGALGSEALSRSAKEVFFLEKSRKATNIINKNLQTLKSENHTVITTNTLTWLQSAKVTPFDIVFLDPPFRQSLLIPVCNLLSQRGWVTPRSYVYVEAEKELNFTVPENWSLVKEKKTGQIASRLYQVLSDNFLG